MSKILQVDASIFGENGVSASLSKILADGLADVRKNTTVVHRDLSASPIPHFDLATVTAIGKGEAALADELIAELQAADTVIIGAPMYNFAVPTQLKAWFDHITRAGVTFKYGENGPEGLLNNKKVFVITTAGGHHADTERDAVTPWLKTILNFVGLDEDLKFICVEGLARSETKEQAKQDAEAHVKRIIARITEKGAES